MSSVATWPATAENWLDERGKGAWIVAMILGFIFFWPVGLALLLYMIWSKRMFANGCGRHGRHKHPARHGPGPMSRHMARHGAMRPSGNSAFDAYKADTLERLEQEQEEFEAFLDRLRKAKDQSEFDAFMEDRARAAQEARSDDGADDRDHRDHPAGPHDRGPKGPGGLET